jgi:UDP-glucose 4-epimerase
MPSAIITGASGFIGSELTKKLISLDWDLVTYSRNTQSNLPLKSTNYKIDWANPYFEQLATTDFVFHAASQNSNKIALINPLQDITNNINILLKLMEEIGKKGHKPHFVYLSTSSFYANSTKSYVNEESKLSPNSLYDISKLTQENYLYYYYMQGIFSSLTILRLANVYGLNKNKNNNDRGFLEKSIRDALAGEEIDCFGDGKVLRDYIYIDDVIEAIIATSTSSSIATFNIYNVGTGKSTYLIDALKLVRKVVFKKTKKEVRLNNVPYPSISVPSDTRSYSIDISKILELGNWKSKVSLEQGINLIIEGLDHEDQS